MEDNKLKLRNYFGTLLIIAVCILVFIIENLLGGSEDARTLMKLGAMNNYVVVGAHQWWRLFTAQFLHIGIWHLVSNLVMIYYMGLVTEPLIGHLRFLLIYLLSGIGGNLMSLAYGSDYSVSAGASTALFGLFGAVIALALRHRNNLLIVYIGRQAFVLALINLFIDLFLPNIDIWGHLGGVISGFLLEMIFTDRLGTKFNPKFRVLAAAVLIVYVVLMVRNGMVISLQ